MSVFNMGSPVGKSPQECKRDIESEIKIANARLSRECRFRDALYEYISDEYYGTDKFSLAELVGSVELQILSVNRLIERLTEELERGKS